MQHLSDRMVESLARADRVEHAHGAGALAAPPSFSIAISREAGSRGAQVARVLGDKLGWPVYDKELLLKIAEQKGLTSRDLENVDERVQSFVEEFFANLKTAVPNVEWAYRHRLVSELMELGEKGRCVIVGRGGAQILPARSTLRVRIVAPKPQRIAHVQASRGITEDNARAWVERTDRDRDRFLRECFHVDPNDLSHYDMILNSAQFDDAECAQLVMQALALREKAARK